MSDTADDLSNAKLKPGATLDKFNEAIKRGESGSHRNILVDNPGLVEDLAVEFYKYNENPKESPNLEVEDEDDCSFVMDCLDHDCCTDDADLALALLRMLKVLSRKYANRCNLESEDIRIIAKYLHNKDSLYVAGEAASIFLNICYEKENVLLVIQENVVQHLAELLDSPFEDVQANAAGALQSLSFQEEGRVHMREANVLPSLFPLLTHPSVKVRTRTVGVIHNMSSDVGSIKIIRTGNAIKELVRMLAAPQVSICGSAAGAIQNMSREQASKQEIVEAGGVPPLLDLMFGSDVQSQVCAAGALLNLLGPQLESDPNTGIQTPFNLSQRRGLSRLVMLSVVTGMAFHGLYTDDAES
eukprot:749421-Hanusia_phi.AAC.4